MKRNARWIDISGQTFGYWLAIEYVGKAKWRFKCTKCGRERIIHGYGVRRGGSTMCRRCASALALPDYSTHRESKSPVYRRWQAMKTRCTNYKSTSYKNYGGRGISVCKEWMDSFEAFRDHIGPLPTPKHTVDRINNDGNYEPGNVRWATHKEQRANTRPPKPPRKRKGYAIDCTT